MKRAAEKAKQAELDKANSNMVAQLGKANAPKKNDEPEDAGEVAVKPKNKAGGGDDAEAKPEAPKQKDDPTGVFPNVTPGAYRVTVKMPGFRTAEVSNVSVEVNKSLPLAIKLEVGGDKEIVEVSASASVQLQTVDAQIGNALSTDSILRLPTLQRNVTELMNLQPGVVAHIEECGTDNWCRIEVKGYKGWLRRDDFFGTYPEEAFESD